MSQTKQSAQSPSAEPQPTKEESYLSSGNPVSKNPHEEACSDTPLTSDPYENTNNSGGDYLSCRKLPRDKSPRPASPAFFIPHSIGGAGKTATGSGSGSGSGAGHSSSGSSSPSHSPAPAPVERGLKAGGGVQYTSIGGPQGLQRKGSSHPLRHAQGVYDEEEQDRGDNGNTRDYESNIQEGGANGDRETEQVKMAPPGEGKVARAVEGLRDEARVEQASGGGGHVGRQERGVKYSDLGLGEEHGHQKDSGGESESGERRRSSAGQRHGRIRGEVSLDEDEAELERKKAQQSWDREQVKEARSEGKDVDGGSFGARPHAEVD